MVSAAEIRDEASLRAWLEGRPREDAVAIAARAALRVAPVFWRRTLTPWMGGELSEVVSLRALLVSFLQGRKSSMRIQSAAFPAMADVRDSIAGDIEFAHDSMDAALSFRAIYASVGAAVDPAAVGIGTALEAVSCHHASEWGIGVPAIERGYLEAAKDAAAIESARDLFSTPLWHGKVPKTLPMVHRDWRARGSGWEFWADWYEGFLTGKPLDLDLLEQVALILSEDWDKGDDHVNAIIARIYEKHQIADAAVRLEADLVAAVTATPGIGHNGPPEEASELPLIAPPIQEPLRAIREEARAAEPDKGRVAVALLSLKGLLMDACNYAGRKADRAIDKSIDYLVPAGLTWLLANQIGLTQLIQMVTKWLATP